LDSENLEDSDENESDEEEAIQNWEIEQSIVNEEKDLVQNSTYGFGNERSDIFQKLEEESSELFENYQISTVPNDQRSKLRLEAEIEKFNEEHYLADLFDPPDELLDAHNYNGFWTNQKDGNKGESELSKEEKEVLVSIKSKIMSLDQKQTRMIYSGLVEIIFSYCYISRSFYGEMEPEASWIIAKISPMLSWLNVSSSPREALVNCFRRALMFPLYRSFSLCAASHQDTITIISNRVLITKLLLHIRTLFNRREPYYLLNQLYIDDYIIWIQSRALEENLKKLAKNLARFRVEPKSLNLDLELLERVARMTIAEADGDDENECDLITMEEAMEKLGIELNEGEFVSTYEKECLEEKKESEKINTSHVKLIEEI